MNRFNSPYFYFNMYLDIFAHKYRDRVVKVGKVNNSRLFLFLPLHTTLSVFISSVRLSDVTVSSLGDYCSNTIIFSWPILFFSLCYFYFQSALILEIFTRVLNLKARKFASRRLRNHTNFVHLGKRVPCPECGQELANSGSLAIHMANKHQGITHSCPECEFVSSIKSSIKRHVQSVHQGIRYPCDQCDFLATSVYNLRKHRRRKHNIEIQASAQNHACNTRQKYS